MNASTTSLWLCHADVWQVSDLPKITPINLSVYDRGSETLGKRKDRAGKSETCRASAWQSQCGSNLL